MLRKIFAIIRKEILIRFASPSEWLFFLVLPVAFTFILSGGTGGQGDIDTRIRLIIVDQAKTSLSSQLIRALQDSEAIRPEVLTLEKAEKAWSQRQVPALLIIPASFSLEQVIISPQVVELRQQPNNMDALVIEQAVATQIANLSSAVDIANASVTEAELITPFSSESARAAYFETALSTAQDLLLSMPERLTVLQGGTVDSIEYDPRANSSAGQLITWVFIPLIGLSSIFAYERLNGTLRRLLITPTQKATYLLGTILAHVITAMGQMLLLIGFGVLVLKVNWGQAPGALFILLFVSTLAAASLGTTLGAFVKTSGQATGLSIMIGMLMALFGGCWYPLELFPQFIRTVVKILPTTWAMEGILNIVVRGQGLMAVLPTAGVLLGFAAVFFTIGVWRFKFE
jgi:ABC-2 type transport system permease protein